MKGLPFVGAPWYSFWGESPYGTRDMTGWHWKTRVFQEAKAESGNTTSLQSETLLIDLYIKKLFWTLAKKTQKKTVLVEAVETETLKEILQLLAVHRPLYIHNVYTCPYFSRLLLLDSRVDGSPGLCWTLLVPIWPIVFWLEPAGRMLEFGKKNWHKKSWEYAARFL